MSDTQQTVEWGAAMLAQPGQQRCGDHYLVEPLPDGLLVAVIDGLGHGPKAADAAQAAVDALRLHTGDDLISLVKRCHQALTGTRGAVMSLAAINTASRMMNWISVGNVAGILVRADRSAGSTREHLLLRGGVVGYRLPTLRIFSETLLPGDTLVFTTDGIRSAFVDDLPLHLPPQAMAEAILVQYNRGTDDATVVTARFAG